MSRLEHTSLREWEDSMRGAARPTDKPAHPIRGTLAQIIEFKWKTRD